MNLIPCAEHCRFQQDGYCALPQQEKTVRCDGQAVKCLYFSPAECELPRSAVRPAEIPPVENPPSR